jgi:hypothetical protein
MSDRIYVCRECQKKSTPEHRPDFASEDECWDCFTKKDFARRETRNPLDMPV